MEYEAKNAALSMMVFLCVFIPLGLLTILFFIKWIRRKQKKEQDKEMEIYYAELERRRQEAYQSLLEEKHRKEVEERILIRPHYLGIENPNLPGLRSDSRISNASSSTDYLLPTPHVEQNQFSQNNAPKSDTPTQQNNFSQSFQSPTSTASLQDDLIEDYTENLTLRDSGIKGKNLLSGEENSKNLNSIYSPSNPSTTSSIDVNSNKTLSNSSQLYNSDENFPHKYESDLHNMNSIHNTPDQLLQIPKNENRLTYDKRQSDALPSAGAVNPKIQIKVDSNAEDQKKASVLLQSDL